MKKQHKKKLYDALAKMSAAFPAGEYHLNEKQNIAMNALGDAIFTLSQEDSDLAELIDNESDVYNEWVLSRLVENGTISKDDMEESLRERRIRRNQIRTSRYLKLLDDAYKATKGSHMMFA